MKTRIRKSMLLMIACFFFMASGAQAFEIITKTDVMTNIIVSAQLLKTADNGIILFDASGSMDKPYKDTGMTRYEAAKNALFERNSYFPEDLGHNIGLYLFTPWKELLPIQPYNRAKAAAALESLPEKPTGPTLVADGLRRLETILKKLEGSTAVFLFTDGTDTKLGKELEKPSAIARELAQKYDVCFYIITTDDDYQSTQIYKTASNLNACSRVIGFDQYVQYSEFNTEALFTVKAEADIITTTDTQVVGIKAQNLLFGFDKAEVPGHDFGKLADFMKSNPESYVVLAGHTDNIGSQAYNLPLSRRRATWVAETLIRDYGIDRSRVLPFWYGKINPVASNDTAEGRSANRRVEIVVGIQ